MKTGTLFLVVGPSGVGKDALIDGLKQRLQGETAYDFPMRYITRQEDAGGEQHHALTLEEFAQAQAAGQFSLWWDAHGLSYGIPASIKETLAQGRHVIVNVSRTILDEARAQFNRVRIISVTASGDVLRSRLEKRGRESQADIAQRIARAAAYQVEGPDVYTLTNDGSLEEAVSTLLSVIRNP